MSIKVGGIGAGGMGNFHVPGFLAANAEIVAIADVFDALLSVRPYKPAWPIEKAMQYMRESSGSHFDPSLLGTFLAILPDCLEVRERYRDD